MMGREKCVRSKRSVLNSKNSLPNKDDLSIIDMITQQDILDQQESMQNDLRSILDGIDDNILDNVCQV